MLSTLLKNDIRDYWQKISLTWLFFLFIGISIIFFFPFRNSISHALAPIAVGSYLVSSAGFYLTPVITALVLFNKSMYDNNAYLTHSIPAKTSSIVISKLLTYTLFSALGAIISAIIIEYLPKYFFSTKSNTELIREKLPNLADITFGDVVIQIGIPMLLAAISLMLLFILATSISHRLLPKYQSIATVLIVILLLLLTMGFSLLLFKLNITDGSNLLSISSPNMADTKLNGLYIDQIIFYTTQIIVLFGAVVYVNNNKLKV